RSGKERLLRVAPSQKGQISSLIVYGSGVASDMGVGVGATFKAVRDALGPLECELTYHDDPLFPEQMSCSTRKVSHWTIFFEKVATRGLHEGSKIAPERQEKLLGRAKVEAIEIN